MKPIRIEYFLTRKGRDLSPSLIALMHWGDRWYADGEPPTILTHSLSDTALEQITHSPTCNVPVNTEQISSRPGGRQHLSKSA